MKLSRVVIYVLSVLSLGIMGYAEGLTIAPDGRASIENDIIIPGKVISDPNYADWAVGQYYSTTPENRTTGYDFLPRAFQKMSGLLLI